jgi:two-component system alkaline phosphatase synthesis response regulator PhoP
MSYICSEPFRLGEEMSRRVLIVEDDTDLNEMIGSVLLKSGYESDTASGYEEMQVQLGRNIPELILLDQKLPGKEGLDIIKELRTRVEYAHIPVIMVTGCLDEETKVQGLYGGADDYITKPFSHADLIARITAVLRRSTAPLRQSSLPDHSHQETENLRVLAFREIEMDLSAHGVSVNNVSVHLTLTEFNILKYLIENQGRVVSRNQLCATVLEKSDITDRTIDVHVAALRKKMGSVGQHIVTVRGVGYRLAAR